MISQVKKGKARIILAFIAALTFFGLATNFRATPKTSGSHRGARASAGASNYVPQSLQGYLFAREDQDKTQSLPHHPFDNACKFPMPNFYASDFASFRVSERLRTLQCPYEDYDFATMDSEGCMYVHNHFEHYPNITKDVTCKVVFLSGGLRNKTTNEGKNIFTEVKTVDAPENTRFFVNSDAFYIRCFKNNSQIWQQVYPGMRDIDKPINTIEVVKDLHSFDSYGRQLKQKVRAAVDRLSIDILGIDSTSRTMFYRHMPRTVETMNRLGFDTLYGYNKLADNSMVNLGPILAGDIPLAKQMEKYDESGDINIDWVLPTHSKMDPDSMPFLFKWMKEKYGCRTMFNEDISMKSLGLFNYPTYEFLPGFTENPADHYYRAFYLAVYDKWKYGPCKDGTQIQKMFLDLWYRFQDKYKDICHFGFTFVTTLTHEAGLILETVDEHISSRLEHLHLTGALDNTATIVMGDHGNRIGLIQFSYTGRIEERMPLFSIRFPSWFKQKYPKEYGNFQKNKWKLTSNFDIHQTLKDIAQMRFGDERANIAAEGRGISLFDEIPTNRSCSDVYIPENFCTCLIDRSNLKKAVGKTEAKPKSYRIEKSMDAVREWFTTNNLLNCVSEGGSQVEDSFQTLGLNPLARHGLRTKTNLTKTAELRKADPKMEFFIHEFHVKVPLRESVDADVKLLFRVQEDVKMDKFEVVFEPHVREAPASCRFNSVFDVCDCLKLNQ